MKNFPLIKNELVTSSYADTGNGIMILVPFELITSTGSIFAKKLQVLAILYLFNFQNVETVKALL